MGKAAYVFFGSILILTGLEVKSTGHFKFKGFDSDVSGFGQFGWLVFLLVGLFFVVMPFWLEHKYKKNGTGKGP